MKSNLVNVNNAKEISDKTPAGPNNDFLKNSMTASYFFPTHKASMLGGLGPEGLGKGPRRGLAPLGIGVQRSFKREQSIPLHTWTVDRKSFAPRQSIGSMIDSSIVSPGTAYREESPVIKGNRTSQGSQGGKFFMDSPRAEYTTSVIHELPEEEDAPSRRPSNANIRVRVPELNLNTSGLARHELQAVQADTEPSEDAEVNISTVKNQKP